MGKVDLGPQPAHAIRYGVPAGLLCLMKLGSNAPGGWLALPPPVASCPSAAEAVAASAPAPVRLEAACGTSIETVFYITLIGI